MCEFLSCNGRTASLKERLLTPTETIEKLDSVIQAIDVRLKAMDYECNQFLLKAKQFKERDDLIRCKAELKMRFEKQKVYERYVNLLTNIRKIRDSIDETQTLSDVASTMGLANKILEEALLKVNPEHIDSLMDQLNDQHIQIREVGDALTRNDDVFDEEAAMKLLNTEEEKVVVEKKKENKRVAMFG